MSYEIKMPEEIDDNRFLYFHGDDYSEFVYKVKWGDIKAYLAKAFRPKYRYVVEAKLCSSSTPGEVIGESVGEYEAADDNEAIEMFKEDHKDLRLTSFTCTRLQ